MLTKFEKHKKIIIDYLFFIIGSGIFAFGFTYFIDPNRISPGGITGIAAVINYLFSFPTGIVLFVLNLPILFLGYKKVGMDFLIKTLFVTAITSLFIDVFATVLPTFKGERLLAAIFGGALSGVGLATVMLRGGTTGGVDVIAVVLKKKFPFMSIGRLVLILDGVVVAIAAVCYREVESALFAVITIFLSGKVIDTVLYGADGGKLIFIITVNADIISKVIYNTVNRGVTVIPSYGGYYGKESKTLLCAVRQAQVSRIIGEIRKADPNAFMIVTATGGIFGRGFE